MHDGDTRAAKTAWMGMFLAEALILGYVESLIPFSFGIPGMKLGLANLAVLLALYRIGTKEAFLIDVLRIVLSGFLFGSLYSILYSMAGGVLSFLAMLLLKKTGRLSVAFVSVAGGVSHNVGQLAVAAFVVETKGLFYYLPPLLVSGAVTGLLLGMIAERVLQSGFFLRGYTEK
ncbi:MAG: Gx transporter family protein [Lachnospiraceae bacterium]|nr:Gx transporter family protein [Lachnospiraceae bacterium]